MNLNAEQPDAKPAAKESTGDSSSFLAELRGGAGVDAGDPNAASASKRKLSGPTMILLAVACAGAALLVGMRQLGLQVATAAEPVAIEYTPGEARIVSNQACEQIVKLLERSGTPVQVPGDQIYKNPFLLQETKPTAEAPVPDKGETSEERKIREAKERQAKVDSALAGLKLLGVLGGKVPVARINTDIVREGDTVAELFTVTAITGTGRSVTLQCDGKDYVISMEDPKQIKGAGTKPAPRQQR